MCVGTVLLNLFYIKLVSKTVLYMCRYPVRMALHAYMHLFCNIVNKPCLKYEYLVYNVNGILKLRMLSQVD